MEQAEKILEVINVSKTFPGVKALDDVSFSVNRGEIRALSGENGAGKSTIIKIISGILKHDTGTILFKNEAVGFHSTKEAQIAGISTVFQELNLIP